MLHHHLLPKPNEELFWTWFLVHTSRWGPPQSLLRSELELRNFEGHYCQESQTALTGIQILIVINAAFWFLGIQSKTILLLRAPRCWVFKLNYYTLKLRNNGSLKHFVLSTVQHTIANLHWYLSFWKLSRRVRFPKDGN